MKGEGAHGLVVGTHVEDNTQQEGGPSDAVLWVRKIKMLMMLLLQIIHSDINDNDKRHGGIQTQEEDGPYYSVPGGGKEEGKGDGKGMMGL